MGPARVLAALILFPAAAAPAALQAPEKARVARIEATGVTVFAPERLSRILRLEPGDELWRSPAELAQTLETRYRLSGYIAARVTGSFDEATGTLRLDVDEGRLAGVAVEGLEGAAAERARRELGLREGEPIREQEVLDALDRLHYASDAVIVTAGDPPYRVQWGPEGATLIVSVRSRPIRPAIRLPGPGVASLYNRVEGFFPGTGLELLVRNVSSYNHGRIYVGGSYGFSSRKGSYALSASQPFGAGRRFVAGYEYHDITDTEDAYRSSSLAQSQGKTIFFWREQDYFRRTGHEAYAFLRVARGTQVGLTYRDDDYGSLPVVADDGPLFDDDRTPNPAIREGHMRSAIGTLRWTSTGDFFDKRSVERESYFLRSLYGTYPGRAEALRVELTYEHSSPGFLGGDFDFSRLIATVRSHHSPFSSRPLHTRVILGLGSGEVPPQKLFAIGGSGTLRGYDRKEFVGENALLASVEWLLREDRGFFPGIYLLYDGGKTWDKDRPSAGWKNVVGVGLEFAVRGQAFLRVDSVVLLEDPGGRGRTSTSFRVKAPF